MQSVLFNTNLTMGISEFTNPTSLQSSLLNKTVYAENYHEAIVCIIKAQKYAPKSITFKPHLKLEKKFPLRLLMHVEASGT